MESINKCTLLPCWDNLIIFGNEIPIPCIDQVRLAVVIPASYTSPKLLQEHLGTLVVVPTPSRITRLMFNEFVIDI